jgi:hypothetical protein
MIGSTTRFAEPFLAGGAGGMIASGPWGISGEGDGSVAGASGTGCLVSGTGFVLGKGRTSALVDWLVDIGIAFAEVN